MEPKSAVLLAAPGVLEPLHYIVHYIVLVVPARGGVAYPKMVAKLFVLHAFLDAFIAYGRLGNAFYASSRVCRHTWLFFARLEVLRVDFKGFRGGSGRLLGGPNGYF